MSATLSTPRRAPIATFALAAASIYAIELVVVHTVPLDAGRGALVYAILVNLLLVVPGLWFWMMVRSGRQRARTLFPVVGISAIGAALVLPPQDWGELRLLVLPVELAGTGLLIWTAARLLRRRTGTAPADPGMLPERIAETARGAVAVPGLPEMIAYEASILVFGLAGWRMRAPARARDFTIYRDSAWGSAALGLGFVLVAEAFPVHVLVARSSPGLAWVLTLLSVYSLLWLIADYQGLRLRPCRLEADALLARVGLRWSVSVPYSAIAAVTAVHGDGPPRGTPGYLRATAVGDPTVLIDLREPLRATGAYGMRKQVRLLGLAPDEKSAFMAELRQAIAEATE